MKTLWQEPSQTRSSEGLSSPSDALDEFATINSFRSDALLQLSLTRRYLPALKSVGHHKWEEGSATALVLNYGDPIQHPMEFPGVGLIHGIGDPYGTTLPLEFWYLEDPILSADHPGRTSLKEKVSELAELAGSENWDGEGAPPLERATIELAQRLVDSFPLAALLHQPDVSATPHGEADFDWVISKDTMLTISVCPSGEIAFAGKFEDSQLDGKEPWAGGLPFFVEMCLQRLHLERLHEGRSPEYYGLW